MDVLSLYNSINNSKRIKAVDTILKRKNLQTKVIISFLKLILTLNNFIFNCTNFFRNKRMCNGNKIRSNIPLNIWGNSYLSINQTKKMKLYFIWTGSTIWLQQKIWLQLLKTPNTFCRHNNNKKIYRKTFNNTIYKKDQPAIFAQL